MTEHFKQNCFIIIVSAFKKNPNQKTAIVAANIYYGKSQRSFSQQNLKSSQTQSKQAVKNFQGASFIAGKIHGSVNNINYCFTSIPGDE